MATNTIGLAQAIVVPSNEFVQWSFTNCQADVICSLALPSGNDYDVFNEMLLMYLEMRSDMGTTIVPIVEPCLQPVLPVEPCVGCPVSCAMVQDLWLGIMREARVCHINEEWLEGQCRCIEGKNCHEDCIAERAINWRAILAGTVITLALVIIISGWIHRGQQKLSETQDKFDRDVWTLRQALTRLAMDLKSRTPFGPQRINGSIVQSTAHRLPPSWAPLPSAATSAPAACDDTSW